MNLNKFLVFNLLLKVVWLTAMVALVLNGYTGFGIACFVGALISGYSEIETTTTSKKEPQ